MQRVRNLLRSAKYIWHHRNTIRGVKGAPPPPPPPPAAAAQAAAAEEVDEATRAAAMGDGSGPDSTNPFHALKTTTLKALYAHEQKQYTEYLAKARAEWQAKVAHLQQESTADLEAFNARLDALNIPAQIQQRAREQVVAELLDPKNAAALDELRRAISGAPGEPGVVRHAATGQIVMDDAELALLQAEVVEEQAERKAAAAAAAAVGGGGGPATAAAAAVPAASTDPKAASTTAAVDDAAAAPRR